MPNRSDPVAPCSSVTEYRWGRKNLITLEFLDVGLEGDDLVEPQDRACESSATGKCATGRILGAEVSQDTSGGTGQERPK
jgi:hypothetical protein